MATHTHTHTHTPDSVSLGVVEFLIEKDQRRCRHKSRVGSKGHTETASGGVKVLVHIATRDCLKQEELHNDSMQFLLIYYASITVL